MLSMVTLYKMIDPTGGAGDLKQASFGASDETSSFLNRGNLQIQYLNLVVT